MTIKNILKEFDEEFANRKIIGGREFQEYLPATYEKLKSFISSSFTSLIEDMEKEIKDIPSKVPEYEDDEYDNGRDDMKKEVLSIINKYKI